MILNGNQIYKAVSEGVVQGADMDLVNAGSLDVRLGRKVLVEDPKGGPVQPWKGGNPVNFREVTLPDKDADLQFYLQPGQFILGETIEVFNLPDTLSAEYKLKSTLARNGLEHLMAGWCDAGWHGSVLTLELKNMTQYHHIELYYGMKIGQIIFHRQDHAGLFSYRDKGSYNGHTGVTVGV